VPSLTARAIKGVFQDQERKENVMSDLSIKIGNPGKGGSKKSGGGNSKFSPNPQFAQQGDNISWNNTTNETHQPWPLDANGNPITNLPRDDPRYLSDPIPPNNPSTPPYGVAQPAGKPATWTVNYICLNHPKRTSERGSIVAQVTPQSK
jgi:hypothetical protein